MYSGHLKLYKRSNQEESLYFGHSFPQPSSQMISNSSEQDTEHWNSHQSIENTEQLPSFSLWGGVSKTWTHRVRGKSAADLESENVKVSR